jgi:hypothetical protein
MMPRYVKWIMPSVLMFQLSVLAYNYSIGNFNVLFAMLIASALFSAIFIIATWRDML